MAELIKMSNYSRILKDGGPFVVLAPGPDGFASTNLTALRADPTALDRFVSLHILEIPEGARASQHVPLSLHDGLRIETLSASKFAKLALRRLGRHETQVGDLGFQIGILGARGSSGERHAAKIVGHASELRALNDTSPPGGVLVIDRALEPYEPNWFFACESTDTGCCEAFSN